MIGIDNAMLGRTRGAVQWRFLQCPYRIGYHVPGQAGCPGWEAVSTLCI